MKLIFWIGGFVPIKMHLLKTRRVVKLTKCFTQTPLKYYLPPHIDIKMDSSQPSLEVKDPQIIFNYVMKSLEEKKGGKHNLTFPKEIILLAGAPGSGKGTITPGVMKIRGLTAPPIVCSDLLESPEMQEIKKKGELIGDRQVVELVFEKLLDPQYQSGVILDGYPRTAIQAECVSLLYDQMLKLRNEYMKTAYQFKFSRPVFHVLVLFCDEQTSIYRQLHRGKEASKKNTIYSSSGLDDLKVVERSTDFDEEIAKKRYKFFRDTIFESLTLLKKKFHYHFIDASASLDQVQKDVEKELAYQSTLELSHETFEKLAKIPSSDELILNARYQLIRRLESYCMTNNDLLEQVIESIRTEFLHILQRQAFCGVSKIRSQNKIYDNPLAVNMVLDIMTERGYQISLDVEKKSIASKIDPATFEIYHEIQKIFHFEIRFNRPMIR